MSELTELFRQIRLSCGIGLSLRIGQAQIEINYVQPIKAQSQDWYATIYNITDYNVLL